MPKTKNNLSGADLLGDRMKGYENLEAGRKFIPLIPIVARMDGRAFHSFTRGLERPFDARLSQAMVNTTIELLKETHASLGYTQSDEITLVWHSEDLKSQTWFSGRIAKMVSQLAAWTTLLFYREIEKLIPERKDRLPTFDARVWQVPTQSEVVETVRWREWDATKNSISMAAQSVYSHHQLHGVSGREKQELLWQKGINWNDYPEGFKRGTYVQRRKVVRKFSAREIEKLPAKHAAHKNPKLRIERTEISILKMPPISQVTNPEAVLFDGAKPKTKKKTP